MPKPITRTAIALGAGFVIAMAIPVTIFYPLLQRLDWTFYRYVGIVMLPFVYCLVGLTTSKTPCYWLAILLAKLEAHQHTLLRICILAGENYRQLYPNQEREVRQSICLKGKP